MAYATMLRTVKKDGYTHKVMRGERVIVNPGMLGYIAYPVGIHRTRDGGFAIAGKRCYGFHSVEDFGVTVDPEDVLLD